DDKHPGRRPLKSPYGELASTFQDIALPTVVLPVFSISLYKRNRIDWTGPLWLAPQIEEKRTT
ncbi:hypothetical protein NDU88_000775, partial [Pleurodeles waltl]